MPSQSRRGNVDEGFASADQVFEDRYSTAFVHDAQMEPRACLAHWEGDKLTLYTPTGGIANCQHDTARDLGLPDDKVRIVCQYMGGNFGNKNQNQDADLIAAMLARQAGAPVMLELSRREDWLGMHGRWHTVQYYKVGAKKDGTVTAIQLRGYSGMGGYRKNSGAISGIELYDCPNAMSTVYPVYTNRTTSGNFRGPSDPQGFFGIESMMDDVAFKLGIDPVEFAMKNMRQPGPGITFTNYSLDECIRRGADAVRLEIALASGAGLRPRSRQARRRHVVHDVPRRRAGAAPCCTSMPKAGTRSLSASPTSAAAPRRRWRMIAAEELGVPLSQVDVVWGDTDRCPYSVGESGSRTTIMTGYAVVEAARDLKQQIAGKGMPTGEQISSSRRSIRIPARTARFGTASGRTSSRWTSIPSSVRVKVTKYVAVHDSRAAS